MLSDQHLEDLMEAFNEKIDQASPANKLSLAIASSIIEELGQELINLQNEVSHIQLQLKKHL